MRKRLVDHLRSLVWRRDRHVLASITAGLVGQASVVVSGPLVARALGPEGRGQLALVIATLIVVVELASLGGASALAYLIPLRELAGRAVLRDHAWWFLGTACAAGTLTALVVVRFVPGHLGLATGALAASAAAAYLLMRYLLAWIQGERWFGVLHVARPIPAVFYALGSLLLFTHPSYVGVSTFLGVHLAGSIACIAYVWWRTRDFSTSGTARLARADLVSFGARSVVGTSTPLDSLSLDQVATGALVGTRALGLYAVGQSFANLSTFVLQSMGFVVGPRLAVIRDLHERRRLAMRWTARATGTAAAIMVSVQFVLEPLTLLLFGDDFRPSVPLGRVLVVAGMMLSIRKFLGVLLLGLDRPGAAGLGEGIALAVFALFAAILHVSWGVMGLAWALLAAGTVASLFLFITLVRALPATIDEAPGGTS